MKKTFISFLLFFNLILSAQTPYPISRHIQTPVSFPIVVATKDNGALLIGGYNNWGWKNTYLHNSILKIDSLANIQFYKEQLLVPVSGASLFADYSDATLCEGDNFAVTGVLGTYNISDSTYGRTSAFCIKYNGQGDTIWYRMLTDTGSMGLHPNSISLCKDSGLIICGISNYEGSFIARMDKQGNFLWFKSKNLYNGVGRSIKQTSDSGYIMIGYEEDVSQNHRTVIWKFDQSGNMQWCKVYCSIPNDCPAGQDIIQLGDHYVCLSSSGSTTLMKIDLNGNPHWAHSFGFGGASYYYHSKLFPYKSDKFLCSSYSGGTLLVDTSLNVSWSLYSDYDLASVVLSNNSILTVTDGNDATAPNIPDEGILITDSSAADLPGCIVSFIPSSSINNVTVTTLSGSMQTAGQISSKQMTITSKPLNMIAGCIGNIDVAVLPLSKNIQPAIAPNPTTGEIHLNLTESCSEAVLEIRNSVGQLIFSYPGLSGQNNTIDVGNLHNGVYFYQIVGGEQVLERGKLIVQH